MHTTTIERIEGISYIINSINNNFDLHNYLWIDLHDNSFNINTNNGLFWIWNNTLSSLLIDFYKLMKENEKFSFKKLINICSQNRESINYSEINTKLDSLSKKYDYNNFELIRSKILAHQDLNVPEQKSKILKINNFIEEINEFFIFLCSELNYQPTTTNSDISKHLQKIFDRLDECDKISSYLIAKQLKGDKILDFELMKQELKQL